MLVRKVAAEDRCHWTATEAPAVEGRIPRFGSKGRRVDPPLGVPLNTKQLMKKDSTRRDFLAFSGLAALALPASAAPTPSTEDSHGYINFLKGKGEDIVPEGEWKATHADILGPFWAGGAPYRGKVTPPLAPGELLVMRGRVWSHRTREPLAHTVRLVRRLRDAVLEFDFAYDDGQDDTRISVNIIPLFLYDDARNRFRSPLEPSFAGVWGL